MVLSYVIEITVPDSPIVFFSYSKKLSWLNYLEDFDTFYFICIFTSILYR